MKTMKIAVITVLCVLSQYIRINGQNPAMFNSAALPPYTTFQPFGNSDANWMVAQTPFGSQNIPPATYVKAVSVQPLVNNSWVNTSAMNCNWITYSNNCTSSSPSQPAYHGCLNLGANTYGVEQWYKIEFNLPCSEFCLNLDLWADNYIKDIFVNTISPNTPGYWANAAPPSGSTEGNFSGYMLNRKVSPGSLCDNWKAGNNFVIIHVKSYGTVSVSDYAGLLVKCSSYTGCEPTIITVLDPPFGCCLGNKCGDQSNPLTWDNEIPLNNHSFNFSGDKLTSDKVNIGENCGTILPGKFNVLTSVQSNGTPNNSRPESAAIFAKSSHTGTNTVATGILGEAANNGFGSTSIGIWGRAVGVEKNIGGNFFAASSTKYSIGVSARATALISGSSQTAPNPSNTYLSAYPGGCSIGLYAATDVFSTNTPGDPSSSSLTNWAGWFDGDTHFNGSGYDANFSLIFSDKTLKREIKKIENASDVIAKLKPSTYYLKTDNEFGIKFRKELQYGFIAQEVEEVLPDLVTQFKRAGTVDGEGNQITKEGTFRALNYTGMIALLTKGMQEQQQQIEELKTTVQALAGVNPAKINTNVVELGNTAVVLNQNVPNPFAESTVISYNIPVDFTAAELIFTTSDGIVIKKFAITQKGNGQLTVYANDLTHGAYTYTLVVDGKTIDSKLMIKQ